MNFDREKVTGKDTIEERARVASVNRSRAREIENRWNWYVLTVPWASIVVLFNMGVPDSVTVRILYLLSLIFLVFGAAIGLASQRHKSRMLYSAAEEEIRLAQLSQPSTPGGEEIVSKKYDTAVAERLRREKSIAWTVVTQYISTAIGLLLLVIGYIVLLLPACKG